MGKGLCNPRRTCFTDYTHTFSRVSETPIHPYRTTGEFPSMTMEERMHVTDLAREHWPGVIINNVSATAVLDARRLLEHSCQTSPNSKVSGSACRSAV